MLPGQMLPWSLESVLDVPRKLPLSFHQNLVSNSWDILDMDKCHQDNCCLDKCQLANVVAMKTEQKLKQTKISCFMKQPPRRLREGLTPRSRWLRGLQTPWSVLSTLHFLRILRGKWAAACNLGQTVARLGWPGCLEDADWLIMNTCWISYYNYRVVASIVLTTIWSIPLIRFLNKRNSVWYTTSRSIATVHALWFLGIRVVLSVTIPKTTNVTQGNSSFLFPLSTHVTILLHCPVKCQLYS